MKSRLGIYTCVCQTPHDSRGMWVRLHLCPNTLTSWWGTRTARPRYIEPASSQDNLHCPDGGKPSALLGRRWRQDKGRGEKMAQHLMVSSGHFLSCGISCQVKPGLVDLFGWFLLVWKSFFFFGDFSPYTFKVITNATGLYLSTYVVLSAHLFYFSLLSGLLLKWFIIPPDAKTQFIGKDPDAGKDWRQEEKGTTGDEMAGKHHSLDGHELEQTPGDVKGREPWRAAVHGVTQSRTWLSNWTTTASYPMSPQVWKLYTWFLFFYHQKLQ